MYVCMYVRTYVCVYVCVYVCMYAGSEFPKTAATASFCLWLYLFLRVCDFSLYDKFYSSPVPRRFVATKMQAQSPADPPAAAAFVEVPSIPAARVATGRDTGDTSKIADGRGKPTAAPKLTLAGAAVMEEAMAEGADTPPPPPTPAGPQNIGTTLTPAPQTQTTADKQRAPTPDSSSPSSCRSGIVQHEESGGLC